MLFFIGFFTFLYSGMNLYIFGSIVGLTGALFRLRNKNDDRGQVVGSKTVQAIIGEDRVVGNVLGVIAAIVLLVNWYLTKTP